MSVPYVCSQCGITEEAIGGPEDTSGCAHVVMDRHVEAKP